MRRSTWMSVSFPLFLTFSLVLDQACGGGGGGSSAAPASPAPPAPAPQIQVPQTAAAGATGVQASVSAPAGAACAWAIQGGSFSSSSTAATVTFTVGSGAEVALQCTVTPAGGSPQVATARVSVLPSAQPDATITAESSVVASTSGHLASVRDQAGCTYAWTLSGGTITAGQGTHQLTYTAGAAGSLTLACSVSVGNLHDSASLPVVVSAAPAAGSATYGPAVNADSLANTTLGGPNGNVSSYRFRAPRSGLLASVRPYLVWDYTKAGYHAGTGGQVLLTLKADDGSAAHAPAGPALATALITDPLAGSKFPLMALSSPVALSAGQLYHLVWSNPDPDPAANFVSVNGLLTKTVMSPRQPCMADGDWAQLLSSAGGGWSLRQAYSPICELAYSDGWRWGLGYMEVWVSARRQVSGAQAVRQTFTVSGADRSATGLQVRLRRDSGASPLSLRLELADGTLVEQGSVPASAVPTAADGWVTWSFQAPRRLAQGAGYHLVLSAPADTVYSLFPVRKGRDYGFQSSFFADGYAQFSTGSAWAGWTMWGVSNRTDGDLQLAFTVAP